jgi:hypothetical protein
MAPDSAVGRFPGSRVRGARVSTARLRTSRVVDNQDGGPDGGLEWYDLAPDGEAYGCQAKFVFDVDALVAQARGSVSAVAHNLGARRVTRLTFLTAFDLPAGAEVSASGRPRKSARQRWDDAVLRWSREIPGAPSFTVHLRTSGDLLEALLRPGNEGRRWFFFEQMAMSRSWFDKKLATARALAGPRYTPTSHVRLPIEDDFHALAVSPTFLQAVKHKVEREAARCSTAAAALRNFPPPASAVESPPKEQLAIRALLAPTAQAAGRIDEAAAELCLLAARKVDSATALPQLPSRSVPVDVSSGEPSGAFGGR